MTLFQIILVILFALGAALGLGAAARGAIGRTVATLWVATMVAAVVAALWPGLTTVVAQRLGIGRGIDLLLYCTIILSLVGFLFFYIRLRQLRRELTLLVRQYALEHAEPPPHEPDTRTAP